MYLSHARNYGHTMSSVLPTNSKIRHAKIKQWIFHNEICLAAWIGHHFQLSVFASLLICLYPAEWKFIYDVSSFTFQTPAMTWPLVTKCHEVCQCLCCMDDDTQTAQWWGLMVYVSAVGSAASAWAGRVSITFITCVGQLWDAGLILDWDTLIHTDKFYQAETTSFDTLPMAPWHSSGQHLPYILY